jgi:glycine hydroxymethyltransferase
MKEIAELMRMVLLDREDPETVRGQVMEFRKDYIHVHYCFEV